tara:strand:+ start:7655 stop:7936 length:282 start_codon:yes stop_codon:yes gene_type:complete
MPLSAAQPGLQAQIEAAFKKVMAAGEKDGASPDAIIKTLSIDLAAAIHAYTMQAVVNTQGSGAITGVATVVPVTGVGPVVGAAPIVISTGTLA